jgi:hypothetical protein
MILDSQLSFVPIGGNLAVAGAAVPSTNVIDLIGQGVGVAPGNVFGTPTVFGAPDAMGVGGPRPELNVTLGSSNWASGTSLNVALQGAIDTGAGGGYLPGTWNTFAETGAILTANLLANTVIARFPWLPPFPANLRPRFLRLLFTPAGTFSPAGIIASALVTLVRDDQFNKYAAKNFAVA